MRIMIIYLRIESDAFCASGRVMRFPLWKEGSGKAGFKGGGGMELSIFFRFRTIATLNLLTWVLI